MKSSFVLIFLSFIILGIAVNSPILLADHDEDEKNGNGDDLTKTEDEEKDDSSEKGLKDRTTFESEIKNGEEKIKFEIRRTIVNADGSINKIRIKIEEKIVDGEIIRKIKISDRFRGDIEAWTKLDLKEVLSNGEESIFAILSNGDESLIKIMPDRVVEIALERLKSRNLTIELKESVHKNVPRVIYNVRTNKNGRFLGIFKLKLKIEAQIDPETGELIGVSKPWWAFLVAGEDDPDETGEENKIIVELTEENNSSESGTAMLVEENGQVTITLNMIGAPGNVSQPAHIHIGSCPEVGEVKYPLTNVLDGGSVTVLNVTLEQLEIELPLAINIHKSVPEASVYVSCGNIIFN